MLPRPSPLLLVSATLTVLLLAWVSQVRADHVVGQPWQLEQPDGSLVDVRIWGDEYYQVVESPDGYTLVRDPHSGVICYADLTADHNELLSTGVAIGSRDAASLGLERHLRIESAAARAIVKQRRDLARQQDQDVLQSIGYAAKRLLPPPSVGNVQGICLIVDFDDEVATIPPTEVYSYCNQVGYNDYGNNGSVRDYFYDVSDGNLTYTNFVPVAYYRASYLKSYYDDCSAPYGVRARELIHEALVDLNDQGFDFSQYDSNGDGLVDAVNCFYAGLTSCGWSQGLWPHSGSIAFSADGVSTYRYQITGMGSQLKLATFCHENGHMICYWPDLYDYDGDSAGVGRFCIMCSYTSQGNPQEPCAYLKYAAGWATTTQLQGYQAGLQAPSSSNTIFKYGLPTLPNEFFMIENRQRTGRDALIPDAGLAIWHIDTDGNNSDQQMTPQQHYLVTLVQADGRWDLEYNRNTGDATDLWAAPEYTEFTPDTNPNSNWWSGHPSDLAIYDISSSAAVMTFTFNPAGQANVPAQYATIQEAIDAAVAGTQIVLADGTYTGPGNRDLDFQGKVLTVRSASGDPTTCIIDCQGSALDPHRAFDFHSGEDGQSLVKDISIVGGYTTGDGGAIRCNGSAPLIQDVVFDGNQAEGAGGAVSLQAGADASLDGCLFIDNNAASGGGVHLQSLAPVLAHCTFYGNIAGSGSGVYCAGGSSPQIQKTIIAAGVTGQAVDCAGGGESPALSCCDIYGNAGGDWVGCIAGQEAGDGNFSADPDFCDPAAGDFTVRENSPCAPGGHPDGALACDQDHIGARSVGCYVMVVADATTGPLGDAGDGRGVAWGDYDNDGDPDLYIVNHDQPNLLLRNEGGGSFSDVTSSPLDDAGSGNGAAWADYDNDGDIDLYLANEGQANRLFRNEGGGTFVDVAAWPLNDAGPTCGVSWVDYNNDGLLDLYAVEKSGANQLFRSFGDPGGTWLFVPVGDATISDTGIGSCASWADYDNDGDSDVYIANNGPNKLIQNNGSFGFFDVTTGLLGDLYNGAGSVWGDYDNDGLLDLYLANNGQVDLLLRNTGTNFVPITGAGLGDSGPGKGAAWGDFDNDGYLDLYVARTGQEDRLLWNRGQNVFWSVHVPVSDGNGNGAAWADCDGDGDLDLYVVGDGPNKLYRNDLITGNHWLHVNLVGGPSNRSAIGARLRAVAVDRTQIREVAAGSGYLSQNSLTVEFGLGSDTSLDTLEIAWPSGARQQLVQVAADRTIEIVEGSVPSGIAGPADVPVQFALHPCYPNPFNPSTLISYDLPEAARVTLSIYDVTGRRVRVLRTGLPEAPGRHQVAWNGKDDSERVVAAGVYFAKLTAGEFEQTRRMMLCK